MSAILDFIRSPLVTEYTVIGWGLWVLLDETLTKKKRRRQRQEEE